MLAKVATVVALPVSLTTGNAFPTHTLGFATWFPLAAGSTAYGSRGLETASGLGLALSSLTLEPRDHRVTKPWLVLEEGYMQKPCAQPTVGQPPDV